MKKFLLIVLATITFVSCGEDKPKVDSFVLSGKINNFRKRSMVLEGFNFKKKIKFDRKTKTFSDTLKNIAPGHYVLRVGKRPVLLYLTPNEDTKLTADAKKRTKSPTFEGINSKINKYLSSKRKKFGLVLGSAQKLFAMEEGEFLDKNNEYKNALLKLASKSQLPPEYLEMEKRNINYECIRNISNYEKYHRMLTGNEEYVTSDDFPNDIENVDFNISKDFINSRQYRLLLKEHLKDMAEDKTSEDDDLYLTHIETIQTEVTDTLIKNNLIHSISEKALTYTANLQEFYKKYMGYSTSEKNKREITKIYDKLKLIARGQPSPKFVNYDNYEGGKTSLDDLIGKGKYIYIDVWATWCSYCKKEIPLLKNFEVKYHGKNIEFVSINVDTKDKRKKWEQTIKDREMGGVQLFAGNKHEKLKFAQDYSIKGLPRFILIDPDGKIVTANAPRPSQGEKLNAIFEALGIDED